MVSENICHCEDPACMHGSSQAYRADPAQFGDNADPNDGIMVVAAHHHTGAAVTASSPFSESYPAGVVPGDGASNYGTCADAWAPGNVIVSAWGLQRSTDLGAQTVYATQYSGNVNQSNTGWLFLSGTSMAAPHIAGAAAYVADAFNLSTPALIEQKLRSYFRSYGLDPVGLPVNTVQIP